MTTIMPRRLAVLGVFLTMLAASTAMPGCIIVVRGDRDSWSNTRERDTRYVEVAHQPGAPIHVNTENGRVNIKRGEGDDVSITADIGARSLDRLHEMEVVAERRADGSLHVFPRWPQGRRHGNEFCMFDITIPDASTVTIRTSNGAIVVAGVGHSLDVGTSNGSITIEGPTGPVEARTSNGRITATLDPANPGPVALRTSNGRVALNVGEAFTGRIAMSTSNGSVQINDAPPARINSIGRSSATLTFGEGGADSTVRTSNGGVTLSHINKGGAS